LDLFKFHGPLKKLDFEDESCSTLRVLVDTKPIQARQLASRTDSSCESFPLCFVLITAKACCFAIALADTVLPTLPHENGLNKLLDPMVSRGPIDLDYPRCVVVVFLRWQRRCCPPHLHLLMTYAFRSSSRPCIVILLQPLRLANRSSLGWEALSFGTGLPSYRLLQRDARLRRPCCRLRRAT